MPLLIYKITQLGNGTHGPSGCVLAAVVAAPNAEAARNINPLSGELTTDWSSNKGRGEFHRWCETLEEVEVTLLGTAAKGVQAGVLLVKFQEE